MNGRDRAALSLMLTGIISGNKAEEWMKPSGYPQKRGSDNIDNFDDIDNFSKGEPGSSGKENIIVFIVFIVFIVSLKKQ
jgi:hypothetical protein